MNDSKRDELKEVSNSLLYIVKCSVIGIKEVIGSLLNVGNMAVSGIKFCVVKPLSGVFSFSSSKVDKVYKNTKAITKTGQNGKDEPQSTLAKIWKVLNGDIGATKSKSAIKKLENSRAELLKELANPNVRRNTEAKLYVYEAKTPSGKWVNGRFYGFSKMDVNSFLLNEGYEVYKIENNKWIDFLYGESNLSSHKMKTKDLIFWLTQLSTYVKAGITLADAIKILMNQMGKNKTQRGINQAIAYELTMGESFSTALSKQGTVFPPLLINMITAAEATGELEATLDDMVDYYTDVETNRKEMISAMIYPSLVMVFAGGVITFVLLYVVPQFSEIYNSMEVELNPITVFLLKLSAFLQNYFVLILLGLIAMVFAIMYIYKKLIAFRRAMQIFMMKIPVFGNIIIYSEMNIFSKTFASLLKNNVNITESIDILSKITNNEIYKEIMYKTINNIVKGDKISEAFKDHWAIPDIAYHMIVTGESTGQLAEMMDRVASYYKEQHHTIVTSLKSLIEPIMIVSLAVIVGGIILAVIIPMFSMYQQISLG